MTMLHRFAVAGCVYGILGGPVAAVAQPSILSPSSELGPYVVQATLTPGGVTDDAFGGRVFLVNDTVLVPGTGVVYVFERTPGTDVWQERPPLTPPSGVTDGAFGNRVVFVNDTVLVPGTGAVYVFERTPGTDVWQERPPLTPPSGVTDGTFGNRVVFINDTVLVSGTGVVYVFERTPGTGVWVDGAPLTPTAPVEAFGTSFAFDGQRALVAAHGVAVLFRRSGPGAWREVAVLTDPGLDPNSSPGVRIDGDNAIVTSSSTFVFSRRDSQPESWEMSLVVTELPNWHGDPGHADLVSFRDDTLIFHVRGIGVFPQNRLYLFVRDAGGSGQWDIVQSLSAGTGTLVAQDDSRVVVVGGDPDICCMWIYRWNRDVNRLVLETQLFAAPAGVSISGDIMVLRPFSSSGLTTLARNQGGHNAWGRVGLLRAARSSVLGGTISGDTLSITAPSPSDHAIVILASDIDRDGLRDGIDACPRDPQNNIAGGCARDGSAYLVLDDVIALGEVTTETISDQFHITATLTNTSDTAIGNPFFEVIELTGGNLLVNADGGPGGTGATLSPDVGDGILSPGEPTTVTFVIGLENHDAFRFYMSMKGEPGQ